MPFNLVIVTPVTILSCSIFCMRLLWSETNPTQSIYLLVVGDVRHHFTQTEMSIRTFARHIVTQAKTITAFHEPSNPRRSLYAKCGRERIKWVGARPRLYTGIDEKWKSFIGTQGTTQLLIDCGIWRLGIQLCDHRYTWWSCSVDSVHPETKKQTWMKCVACNGPRKTEINFKNDIIIIASVWLQFRICSNRSYRFPGNGAESRYTWSPRMRSHRHRTVTRIDIDSVWFHDRLDKLMYSCLQH